MAFTLEIKPNVRKSLDQVPENYRARIIAIFDEITRNPFFGKKLHGKREGQYSIRIWPYRIIYLIRKKELIVLVIEFGHRQGVYS